MKILELSEGERPREKMLQRGAFALSSGELLAVLLRSGRRGESALELAQGLLARQGTLTGLFSLNLLELSKIPGIGTGKACSLLAAAELGRRFMAEYSGVEKKPLTSARMFYTLMLPYLKGLRREECWALYMNSAMYLLGMERLSRGSGQNTAFDVKDILRGALWRRAYALVLVHNHPSGNPHASRADMILTSDLRRACESMGIGFADHIIVSDDCFYSFAEDRRYER